MRRIAIILNILMVGLLLTTARPIGGQEQNKNSCDGEYKGGIRPTKEELNEILIKHLRWLNIYARQGLHTKKAKKDRLRANLCEADLSKIDLSGAELPVAKMDGAYLINSDLSTANLSGASLRRAKLIGANLNKSYLSGADLFRANLSQMVNCAVRPDLNPLNIPYQIMAKLDNPSGADLSGAILNGANLIEAHLCGVNLNGTDLTVANLYRADLSKAHLSGANLFGTNLSKANFEEADLSGANMINANLRSVHFELLPGTLPNIASLYSARNLETIYFTHSPHSMVELREAFKKAGMRKQERKVTYAIKHTERLQSKFSERAINYVLFELTCAWGLWPGRPLKILGWLILGLSFPYMLIIRKKEGNGRSGIWKIWPEDRVFKDEGKTGPERVAGRKLHRAWLIGFYFSILSAFRIGWRDINVGNWIARMQQREYSWRATGWVRTVSGVQSLVSVYLVVLWLLTYFGRPFE